MEPHEKQLIIIPAALDFYVEECDIHLPAGYDYISAVMVDGEVMWYDIMSADHEVLTDKAHSDLTDLFEDAWFNARAEIFQGEILHVY